ncbi:dipeptidase [Bosea sp. NBC_00550]|uniref:dipeptidase n=1 Tax=Bosea sp. NBC_00550 TaxID=2969621 RepID=UPI00222EA461|nr:dipeptidase [Bosea sp. NBC_00550]UZF94993.1 dipeptidase [Bosea sp. NBC_00550]
MDEAALRQRASEVHASATLIDTQGVGVLLPHVHLAQPEFEGRSHIDRALAGGLTAMNTTIGVGGIASGVDDLRALLNAMYGYQVYFRLHADKLIQIETVAEIETAKRTGRLGIIFGVQNIAPKIDGDLTLLWNLHKLGLRVAQFTHNDRNALGCGCLEDDDTGLTQFGKAAVMEMNRIGLLVDLAHGGMKTALDAINYSETPIIISHANARGLTPHRRNATDEVIRALATRGGVIGVTFYSPFCQAVGGGRPTVANVVDHIAYIADLVGIDHVGLGSDQFESESEVRYAAFGAQFADTQRGFSRETVYAEGLERVECLPSLTAELAKRGFADEDIRKILGDNHLRLFASVWK